MGIIKRYRYEVLLGSALLIVYFILRLTHILSLPIFTDEAIYVRWAQIAKQDAAWRFISLTDGKQPMFTWVTMILMRFIRYPLLAGRITSVLGGVGSTLGMFFLTRELFKNRWIGFLAAAVYIFSPFSLVYDRMALQDTLVCTFLIWGLYISIVMTRQLKSYMPFVAGLIIGGGMLNKTTNFWSIYFLPFTLLLFDWKKDRRVERLVRWGFFALLTTALSYLYYSVLRLSPYFGIVAEKNHTFYFSIHDWLQHPIMFFVGNLHGMVSWLFSYINWLGAFLAVASFFVLKKFWKEKLLLVMWFVIPFFIFALIAKVLYPRYILYMTIFLFPLMAVSLYESFRLFNKKLVGILVLIVFFGMYLWVDRFILFDFAHAPIADADLSQFINAWPAGGGVNEMVRYFRDQSQNHKIYVASEGTFGSVPTLAMEIYLGDNTNIEKRGIYPIPHDIPDDLIQKAKKMPVYMVFEQSQTPPPTWPLTFVTKYQKGIGNWYMSIYQVIPQ